MESARRHGKFSDNKSLFLTKEKKTEFFGGQIRLFGLIVKYTN